MPSYLALVTLKDTTALAENFVVNTLAFDDAGGLTDPESLAEDLADIYVALWAAQGPTEFNEVEVRFYDHADPTPRPIKGQATMPLVGIAAGVGPREVALCLSFYADRNIPRNRGRIYVGPWRKTAMDDRPSGTDMSRVLGLANSFGALGGVDVDWAIYSRTDQVFRHVTNAWVDDAWDTIRSRGLSESMRDSAAVSN